MGVLGQAGQDGACGLLGIGGLPDRAPDHDMICAVCDGFGRGCNALLSSVIERAEVAWQQREGTLTESSSEIGEDLSDVLYIIS